MKKRERPPKAQTPALTKGTGSVHPAPGTPSPQHLYLLLLPTPEVFYLFWTELSFAGGGNEINHFVTLTGLLSRGERWEGRDLELKLGVDQDSSCAKGTASSAAAASLPLVVLSMGKSRCHSTLLFKKMRVFNLFSAFLLPSLVFFISKKKKNPWSSVSFPAKKSTISLGVCVSFWWGLKN